MYYPQRQACHDSNSTAPSMWWILYLHPVPYIYNDDSSFQNVRQNLTFKVIQGDSGGKVNILGCQGIGNCEKRFGMNTFVILHGYRNGAVWICTPNFVIFPFVGLYEERSLLKEGWHSRRIAGLHFGCSWLHKDTWRSTETNSTRSSHTSCKVQWGWRWDFGTFIVNCNRFVICDLLWTVTDLWFIVNCNRFVIYCEL